MDKQAIIEWANNFVDNISQIRDWWDVPKGLGFQTTGQSNREVHIHKGIYVIAEALGVEVTVTNRYAWYEDAGIPVPDDTPLPWEHSFVYRGVTFFQISDYEEPDKADIGK